MTSVPSMVYCFAGPPTNSNLQKRSSICICNNCREFVFAGPAHGEIHCVWGGAHNEFSMYFNVFQCIFNVFSICICRTCLWGNTLCVGRLTRRGMWSKLTASRLSLIDSTTTVRLSFAKISFDKDTFIETMTMLMRRN